MVTLCDNHTANASPNVISPIASDCDTLHSCSVIGSAELLAALKARNITQTAISRVLNVDPSQISQLYKGARQLKLDEAKRLVEAFDLDESSATPPISEQTARLLILHVADTFGIRLAASDSRVQELALDFQAFSKFARAHLPAPSPDATSGFLYGRRSDRVQK